MFVLDEEAESPITQFIYSTRTQFLTGWLNSQLCFGGGIFKWFNLIETSYVGVTRGDLTQVHPSITYTLTCAYVCLTYTSPYRKLTYSRSN